MKKIFAVFIASFISYIFFPINYSIANNSISEQMFLTQSKLDKTIKWKKYTDTIDIVIEKVWDKTKLKNIETKLKTIIDWNKIKNKDSLNKLTYLYKKVSTKLNKLENKLEVTVIFDEKDTSSDINSILNELINLDSIKNSKIEMVEFSDIWVKEYLIKNNINTLPAFIFSTNNFDVSNDPDNSLDGYYSPKINEFLIEIWNWEYFLEIWSTYDPFIIRSEKWYKIIEKSIIEDIKNNSFIKWNSNAKISLIIYSDLECPYCAKLHNDWTTKKLEEKYWTDLNIIYNHFPLYFHSNALPAAEILECSAIQKWSDSFYKLIEIAFENKNSNKEFLIDESVKLWVNKDELNKCLKSSKFEEKINTQMQKWTDIFWITWTPGSVIINNETLEYEILWWAYPIDNFIEIIENIK